MGILLAATLLLQGACHPQAATVVEVPPEAVPTSTAVAQAAMNPTVAYEVDIDQLSLDPPAERVLVTSRGEKFITVSEYNAWLGTYPLGITSEDQAIARKQAVEQMVTFKLLAGRAAESGYSRDLGPGDAASERSMVLTYIHDQMSNISAVTDRQAQEYRAAHADRLAALESPEVPDEIKLAAMKGSVLGERLGQRIKSWAEEADISYAPDVDPHAPVEEAP